MKNITFYGGIIGTGLSILLGVIILTPAFVYSEPFQVMVIFEIRHNDPNWCNALSKTLDTNSIKSTVFISGELASINPTCITSFSENTDIGSQTFSYMELPTILDYSEQLREVELGKKTIDDIGNMNSKLFRSPGLNTDENIFSLLNKNGIEFDMSYLDHYNKFHDGKFLKFDLVSLEWDQVKTTDFSKFDKNIPIAVNFDSSVQNSDIDSILNQLKEKNVKFIKPSDLMN